jgi:hypothetical protein
VKQQFRRRFAFLPDACCPPVILHGLTFQRVAF